MAPVCSPLWDGLFGMDGISCLTLPLPSSHLASETPLLTPDSLFPTPPDKSSLSSFLLFGYAHDSPACLQDFSPTSPGTLHSWSSFHSSRRHGWRHTGPGSLPLAQQWWHHKPREACIFDLTWGFTCQALALSRSLISSLSHTFSFTPPTKNRTVASCMS